MNLCKLLIIMYLFFLLIISFHSAFVLKQINNELQKILFNYLFMYKLMV